MRLDELFELDEFYPSQPRMPLEDYRVNRVRNAVKDAFGDPRIRKLIDRAMQKATPGIWLNLKELLWKHYSKQWFADVDPADREEVMDNMLWDIYHDYDHMAQRDHAVHPNNQYRPAPQRAVQAAGKAMGANAQKIKLVANKLQQKFKLAPARALQFAQEYLNTGRLSPAIADEEANSN